MGHVELRRLSDSDSFDELTTLLHRAYAPLLAQGMRFSATHRPRRAAWYPRPVTGSAPHIQLGLFAGCAEVAGMHVVSAHTRLLADGTSVFVGEHLRWNAGRHPVPASPSGSSHRVATALPDQPGLFDDRT